MILYHIFLYGDPQAAHTAFTFECGLWTRVLYNLNLEAGCEWRGKFKCLGKEEVLSKYTFDKLAYGKMKLL